MTPPGVAVLGYGFMGRAHALALRAVAARGDGARLVSISGRDPAAAERARAEHGFEEAALDWGDQVADDRIEIFANTGPNALHLAPTLAAVRAGKHVLCEKPLGVSAAQAHQLWGAAAQAGVVHLCGFNYRYMPAVRLARELLEAGTLGDPTHFRARFLASSALSDDQRRTWRFEQALAGSGAVADIGSHVVDLARYLVGEPVAVGATTRTFVPERDGAPVDVDDAFVATVEFAGGAIGTLEASRAAGRRSNVCAFEVDGTRGSLSFDLSRMNELELTTTRKESRTIDVTDPAHPFMEHWWPSPGHSIGWGDTFAHEWRHLLDAVAGTATIAPHGADFEDGYRCALVCEAILRSARTGRSEAVG